MNKLLLAATALIGFAAINAANAADLALKAPPPPLVVDEWTGPYIGLNLGGSWGRSRTSYNDPDPAFVPFTTSQHMDGVLGGAQIGYNVQFNRIWLAGLEADFQGTGQRGSATFPPITEIFAGAAVTTVTTTGTLTQKMPWFGTVRGTARRRAWRTLAALRDRRSGLCADQEHRRYQRRRYDPGRHVHSGDVLERQQRPRRMDGRRWRGVDVCQAVERESRISLHGLRPHQ